MQHNSESAEDLAANCPIPEAHPMATVLVGTTLAELAPVLKSQSDAYAKLVPRCVLVVDSLPYEDMRTRLVQAGWTAQQVEDAIPRSSYFQLTSPFTEDFDFDSPLNRQYADMTSDPGVRRAAKNPDAPGCAGIPVLGRARVESNFQELRDFLEGHLQELTRVRKETLALRPGVIAFIFTTFRGGTGSGAATLVAAILRLVMNGGEIHLRAMMPCIYRGDNRSYANAYAALKENQHCHRFGGGVVTKDGKNLKAPFDSVVYTFVTNRKQSLGTTDALMQAAAVVQAYQRVATQSSILARRVDLTDAAPFDHEDNPTHVAVEAALSIRAIPPGVHEYQATRWIQLEAQDNSDRFDQWCQTETLDSAEENRARRISETVIDELNLNREHLLTRLDPTVAPLNALRASIEHAKTALAAMRAANIKSGMKSFTNQIQEMFNRFQLCWAERAGHLAKSLPIEIAESVRAKTATDPHLELAVVARLRERLLAIARDSKAAADQERSRRGSASSQLGTALNSLQEARGVLGFIREDEVTRDAAHKACDVALLASVARAQQERNEYLTQAIQDGVSTSDGKGEFTTIASVTLALVQLKSSRTAAVREANVQRREQLDRLLIEYGQRVQKRSPIFQRSLAYDGITLQELDETTCRIRTNHADTATVRAYLEGKQDLQATLAGLLPLLPTFSETGRSLSQLLLLDHAKRHAIVQLLRSCIPFSPLDREIEEQQGLRNRLDNLQILEIPGGADGPLADLFVNEGIVSNRNHIVDSAEQEIRLYKLRQGLPYSALQLVDRYRDRHDQYLAHPGAVTPYTIPNADRVPGINPPSSNLADETSRLLYVTKAILPNSIRTKPSGGYLLRHKTEATKGFSLTDDVEFPDFNAMKIWLAKRIAVRRALTGELNNRLDSDATEYKNRLIHAWKESDGEERHFIQTELLRLKVDLLVVA
jgi:hypothetical protein